MKTDPVLEMYEALDPLAYDNDDERYEHACKIVSINNGGFARQLQDIHHKWPTPHHNHVENVIEFCSWVAEQFSTNSFMVYQWYKGQKQPSYLLHQDMIDVLNLALERDYSNLKEYFNHEESS